MAKCNTEETIVLYLVWFFLLLSGGYNARWLIPLGFCFGVWFGCFGLSWERDTLLAATSM